MEDAEKKLLLFFSKRDKIRIGANLFYSMAIAKGYLRGIRQMDKANCLANQFTISVWLIAPRE